MREGPVEIEACGIAMNLSYLWNALTDELSETIRLRVMGPILKELTEPYPYSQVNPCLLGLSDGT